MPLPVTLNLFILISWLSHCAIVTDAFCIPISTKVKSSVLLALPMMVVSAYLNEESCAFKGKLELKFHQEGIQNERN